MKTTFAAILITIIAAGKTFAGEWGTTCQSFELNPNWKRVEVYLNKEGKLQTDKIFEIYLSRVEGQDGEVKEVKIEGLKVELEKATMVDKFTKRRFGLGGPSITEGVVYGVKFHISADEAVGSEIQGCIPRPVNEVDVYAICTESKTTFGNRQ